MHRRAALGLALAAACPAAALAHHGWGSFDREPALDVTAPVESSTYVNPHGMVTLRHEGRALTFELAPVSRMTARGLRAEDIAPGQSVRLFGYQNTQNPALFRAEWIEVGQRRVELR